MRKNCRPDHLCAARLKARQFVIKITNHKKSFGNAPVLVVSPEFLFCVLNNSAPGSSLKNASHTEPWGKFRVCRRVHPHCRSKCQMQIWHRFARGGKECKPSLFPSSCPGVAVVFAHIVLILKAEMKIIHGDRKYPPPRYRSLLDYSLSGFQNITYDRSENYLYSIVVHIREVAFMV